MSDTVTMELAILSPRPRPRYKPILYVEECPDPEYCPYCHHLFTMVVGCQKMCECGYVEGCED